MKFGETLFRSIGEPVKSSDWNLSFRTEGKRKEILESKYLLKYKMMLAHFIYRSQHPFIPSISFESETIFWDWILPSKELKNFLSIIQLYLEKRIQEEKLKYYLWNIFKSIKVFFSKLKLAWIITLPPLEIVTDSEHE